MDPTTSTPSKIGASARRKAAASRRAARQQGQLSNDPPPDPPSSTSRKNRYHLEHEGAELNEHRNRNPSSHLQQHHLDQTASSDKTNLLSSLSMALSSNLTNVATSTAIHVNNAMRNHRDNDNDNDYFSTANIHNSSNKSSKSKKLSRPSTQFSSYLHFQKSSLAVLFVFVTCYSLVLICCWPMISTLKNNDGNDSKDMIAMEKGASFQHIRGRKTFLRAKHAVSQKLGTFKEHAVEWEKRAKKAVDEVDSKLGIEIGEKIGRRDAMRASLLMEEAVKEFEKEEAERKLSDGRDVASMGDHDTENSAALQAWEKENAFLREFSDSNNENGMMNSSKQRLGFMVLGMHRSGTSMLSGLLVQGFGYETGGPLIGAAFDNEKGFYERIDVVLQNDEFFQAQRIGWSYNVYNYDSERALFDKTRGTIKFREGERALQFLNGRHDIPYLQKDPRMCIALPTWLKLLNHSPAVVFTYRHPLEVAMSLKKREENFTLEHGLRLWIVYNMRAIQNSAGLCRVLSSNDAVNKDAFTEVQRIADELTTKCHVKRPPTATLSRKVVDEFVDPKLQHNHKQREEREKNLPILEDFGNGCVAREIQSDYTVGSSNQKVEAEMYLMAMSVYCDLESGKAYDEDYEWPDLVNMKRPARIS